jgi:hypothetical protein
MKLKASAPAPRMLASVLRNRAFLDGLDRRMSRLASGIATRFNESPAETPVLRVSRHPAGLRIQPADKAAARDLEYGSLRTAPRPWAARLTAALRDLAARLRATP